MRKIISVIGAALVATLPSAVAAPADHSTQDQTFVNEAARGGMMEVQLGKLAEQNASNPIVKQFGERMVTDHTRLNNELSSTAKSIGLTVPDTLSKEQQTEYDKLAKLSGTAFDTAYMNLMVKVHTSDLAAFRKEEATTQNQDLKAVIANKAIPVISEHLALAKSDSSKLAAR